MTSCIDIHQSALLRLLPDSITKLLPPLPYLRVRAVDVNKAGNIVVLKKHLLKRLLDIRGLSETGIVAIKSLTEKLPDCSITTVPIEETDDVIDSLV